MGAYRAFIWEVANTYDESYVATQSLQELLLQARANGKVVTELERVYELESTSGSWLQAMMKIMADERGGVLYATDERYCIDNGAMIAWPGLLAFGQGDTIPVEESSVTQRYRTDDPVINWRDD